MVGVCDPSDHTGIMELQLERGRPGDWMNQLDHDIAYGGKEELLSIVLGEKYPG
jgi:hypothetical protein